MPEGNGKLRPGDPEGARRLDAEGQHRAGDPERAPGAGVDAETWESVMYEGYGPGGVALLIEALTDNLLTAPPRTFGTSSPSTAVHLASRARSRTYSTSRA